MILKEKYSLGNDKQYYCKFTEELDRCAGFDTREYPYGRIFSHAIGITTHGKYGLEKMCNYDLLSSQTNAVQKIVDDFS